MDLVRSSLNPVGALGAPGAGGGYGRPGPARFPGFSQPLSGDGGVGFDPFKAFNVVRASARIALIDLANFGRTCRSSLYFYIIIIPGPDIARIGRHDPMTDRIMRIGMMRTRSHRPRKRCLRSQSRSAMQTVGQPPKDWKQCRRALRELRRAATRRGTLSLLLSLSLPPSLPSPTPSLPPSLPLSRTICRSR